MRQSPEITTIELAEHLGITQSGIEKQISKMRKAGDIIREGDVLNWVKNKFDEILSEIDERNLRMP